MIRLIIKFSWTNVKKYFQRTSHRDSLNAFFCPLLTAEVNVRWCDIRYTSIENRAAKTVRTIKWFVTSVECDRKRRVCFQPRFALRGLLRYQEYWYNSASIQRDSQLDVRSMRDVCLSPTKDAARSWSEDLARVRTRCTPGDVRRIINGVEEDGSMILVARIRRTRRKARRRASWSRADGEHDGTLRPEHGYSRGRPSRSIAKLESLNLAISSGEESPACVRWCRAGLGRRTSVRARASSWDFIRNAPTRQRATSSLTSQVRRGT